MMTKAITNTLSTRFTMARILPRVVISAPPRRCGSRGGPAPSTARASSSVRSRGRWPRTSPTLRREYAEEADCCQAGFTDLGLPTLSSIVPSVLRAPYDEPPAPWHSPGHYTATASDILALL